jgi:hypothetical protein
VFKKLELSVSGPWQGGLCGRIFCGNAFVNKTLAEGNVPILEMNVKGKDLWPKYFEKTYDGKVSEFVYETKESFLRDNGKSFSDEFVLRLTPAVLRYREWLWKKVGCPEVAILARGTDKVQIEKPNVPLIFNRELKTQIDQNPDKKFFLLTDCEFMHDCIKKKFPKNISSFDMNRSKNFRRIHDSKTFDEAQNVRDMMRDLLVLSKVKEVLYFSETNILETARCFNGNKEFPKGKALKISDGEMQILQYFQIREMVMLGRCADPKYDQQKNLITYSLRDSGVIPF